MAMTMGYFERNMEDRQLLHGKASETMGEGQDDSHREGHCRH